MRGPWQGDPLVVQARSATSGFRRNLGRIKGGNDGYKHYGMSFGENKYSLARLCRAVILLVLTLACWYESATAQEVKVFPTFHNPKFLAFSSDARYLIVSGAETELIEIESGKTVLKEERSGVAILSPDSKQVLFLSGPVCEVPDLVFHELATLKKKPKR